MHMYCGVHVCLLKAHISLHGSYEITDTWITSVISNMAPVCLMLRFGQVVLQLFSLVIG